MTIELTTGQRRWNPVYGRSSGIGAINHGCVAPTRRKRLKEKLKAGMVRTKEAAT